jgi:hypothetical protein
MSLSAFAPADAVTHGHRSDAGTESVDAEFLEQNDRPSLMLVGPV